MATHSSVLAWRIPGMGEPGGLPSMGSHSRTRLKRLSSSREGQDPGQALPTLVESPIHFPFPSFLIYYCLFTIYILSQVLL